MKTRPDLSTLGGGPRCWLWPDHAIGKQESRQLREEHNAVVNSHAELLAACVEYVHAANGNDDRGCGAAYWSMRDAIAKTTEGGA